MDFPLNEKLIMSIITKNKLQKTLRDRNTIYGTFEDGSKFVADAIKLVEDNHHKQTGQHLTDMERVLFFHLFNKLSRVCVTVDHIDTWHDISGYAKLTEEYYTDKKQREEKDNAQES